MPVTIWEIKAASQVYLENCEYYSPHDLKDSGQARRLTGADILEIVQAVLSAKSEAARGTHHFTIEDLRAKDIDDYLNSLK